MLRFVASSHWQVIVYSVFLLSLPGALAAPWCPSYSGFTAMLGPQLSNESSITEILPQRWSQFGAPRSRVVINAASEQDVSTSVRFCNQENLTFVAQNGGNGWADTFHLGPCGVIINIENLNKISITSNKTQATIGGGVRVKALVDAGYASGVRFATATCNCLGFLGAALGGGLARASGLYGMSVDQIISMNVVLASGVLVHVDSSNADLWWALKGAGPNFGIVTSAVIKAYEVPKSKNFAWEGAITFADDKIEPLISAINNTYLHPHMQIDFLFSAAANGSTSITVVPLFLGPTDEARKAFKAVLDVGYISDGTAELPYNQWNAWADSFCSDGERKPAYGVSTNSLDPQAWSHVYQEFKAFVRKYPQARNSSILAETYAVNSSAIRDGSGSYPFREVKTHMVAIPWYADQSFDPVANSWGQKVRSLLRATDGLDHNANYINFAHGDETLEDIYGPSLERLQALKREYDPFNRFNQWFTLA